LWGATPSPTAAVHPQAARGFTPKAAPRPAGPSRYGARFSTEPCTRGCH
jgi:hypothetical protein